MDIGWDYEPAEDTLTNLLFEEGRITTKEGLDKMHRGIEDTYRHLHPTRLYFSKVHEGISKSVKGLVRKIF